MKVFKETQRFTQTWLLILIAVSLIVPIAILVKAYNDGQMSLESLFWTGVMILASSAIIFIFKLTTRIDEKGIHYKFSPIHFSLKTIRWNTINKAYVRTYDPIGEYGGWGLKGGWLWNKSKGTAINISGDIGIQLELNDGTKLLIGTQKKEQAIQVLQTYMNSKSE